MIGPTPEGDGMATITGTSGNDSITPSGVSAGVTGGTPSALDDAIYGTAGSDTIDGGGGYNFISYYNVNFAVTLTVGAAVYSGTVGKAGGGQDSYSNIQLIIGSYLADTLTGTTGTSQGTWIALRGGQGNDTINGLNNYQNCADYSDSAYGVTINLGAGTATGFADVGTDTLIDVVRARGSFSNDTLIGGSKTDAFIATQGTDTYDGAASGASLDYQFMGSPGSTGIVATAAAPNAGLFGYGNWSVVKAFLRGTDTATAVNQIFGSPGNDAFFGLAASVTYSFNSYSMRGDAGNDTYTFYGNALNRLDYSGLNAAVTVDLQAGTANKGLNGTDTLNGVRQVQATNHNDTLLGSSDADAFLVGAAGAHTIDGRGGTDLYRFSGSTAITLDLAAGTVTKAGGIVDTLVGIENASGGDGDDILRGDAGANFLGGLGGNNTLDGRAGEDWVTLHGFFNVTPTQGGSVDLRNQTAINPFGGTDTLVSIENAAGSIFADTLTGLVRADGLRSFLRGGGGNDTLRALDGAGNAITGSTVTADYSDALAGVTVNLKTGVTADDGFFGGQDTLVGITSVRGTAFADRITGSDGSDAIDGGTGGADALAGGLGDDTYTVGSATTVVTELAGGGNDTALVAADGWAAGTGLETLRLSGIATSLTGSGDAEVIWGQALLGSTVDGAGGADTVWGGFLADTLRGGVGNDILLGVGGADRLEGGADDDLYVIQDALVTVVEQAGGGRDSVWVLANADWTMPLEVEVAYLGGAAFRFTGGAGDDVILGNGMLSNIINGGGGNDQIYGGALSDTLRGGFGNDAFLGRGGGDTMEGGAGDDVYVIGDAGDVVVEQAGEGTDVALVVSASWTVAAGVEVVYLGGSGTTLLAGDGAQILVGNGTLASTLSGGGGDDTIFGTAFTDVLNGGVGNDILSVGGGADQLLFNISAANGGFGHDSVFGLSLGATLDFRGSGLAGVQDLTFVDLGGAIRVTSAVGMIDFYAAPLSAIQGMTMLF